MEWFRWYGGTHNDPKLQWVARRACQPVAAVLAVWVAVLERAHDNEVRGCCDGLDFESLDISLGLDDGSVSDIYNAMVAKAMIVDGGMVANWEKRQPKREDENAAERKREYREKLKLQKEIEQLQNQLKTVMSQMSHNVPQCPTVSLDVTTEERRREEIREEETLKPKKPTTDAGVCARVRETFTAVLNEKRVVLVEKFPQCLDVDVVVEKLIAYQESRGMPADPWLIMLRWFEKEWSRGQPKAGREQKTFDALKQERTMQAARDFAQGGGEDDGGGSGTLCIGYDRFGSGVSC